MQKIKEFITNQKIDINKKLKYLITIPCVNRAERNAINVIDKTFKSFEKSGLFDSSIDVHIILFESGSNDTSYLNFLDSYREKYCNENSISKKFIQVIKSDVALNGVSNTLKMFYYLNKLPINLYDFVLWMDDDVFVCKNFIKNADTWIKNYANFSIYSSLYVPYNSSLIKNRKNVRLSDSHIFYGTCCVIFKPSLSRYVIPLWYDQHFERFEYNPDTRFRDCIRKYFPSIRKICVSEHSLVQHMNIGSAIKQKKIVKKGHKCHNFIGEDNDPEFYINDI